MPIDPTFIESGGAVPDRPPADKAVERTLIEARNEGGADERTLLEAQPPPTPGGGVGLNLVPGAQFLEYRLVEPIKVASGEAELWVADGGGRRVVLKFYRWGLHPKAGLTEKLNRISKALIVEVYGRGTSPDGRDYEILEFIRHGTLADFGKGGLPEAKVREVLRELTDAVAALHAENILHRDLKPANVLVRTIEPLNLVLTDFGISSVMDISLHVTSVNRTAAYSAPEAMTGVVSKASDWWSVGVMVMELLQGAQPFAGLDERAVNFALVMRGIAVPKAIPTEWQSLLKGLLTRDHAKRWNEVQIGQWLDGKTNIPIYYNEATAAPVVRIRKNRPCQFLKTDYFEPGELALAMAQQWDEAAKRFERGIIADWIRKDVQNADLASLLIDVQEDACLNSDQKLSVALLAMNDQLPLSWRGEVVNQDWMATHPEIGIQFLNSDLSSWLKRLRQDAWLEELKERYFALRHTIKNPCDDETLLKAALATDEALLQAGKNVQEHCISSSDPELGDFLRKKQLLPVEAAVLALAPPTLFTPRGEKEIAEFAETLARITRFNFPTTRAIVEQRFDHLRSETAKLEKDFARLFDSMPIPQELIKRAEVKALQADAVLRALLTERDDAEKAVLNILPQRLGAAQLGYVNQQLQQIKERFSDIDERELNNAIQEWQEFYKSLSLEMDRLEHDFESGAWEMIDKRLHHFGTDLDQRERQLNDDYKDTEFGKLGLEEISRLRCRWNRASTLIAEIKYLRQRRIKRKHQLRWILVFASIIAIIGMVLWSKHSADAKAKAEAAAEAEAAAAYQADAARSAREKAEAAAAAQAKAVAVAKAKAEAEAERRQIAADVAAASAKRLEWIGATMRRAGYSEEQIRRTLTQGGTVVAWGKNDDHQCDVPIGLSNVVGIAAGEAISLALKQDGTVVRWGRGGNQDVPVGLKDVVAIAAGDNYFVALKYNGTVVAWQNLFSKYFNPPEAFLTNVVAIDAATEGAVALKYNGTVVTWSGYTGVREFVGLSNVVSIAMGNRLETVLALMRNGKVVTWEGTAAMNGREREIVPPRLNGVVAIAQGSLEEVALRQDGKVVVWSRAGFPYTTNVVPNLSNVLAISVKSDNFVALKKDGTVVAWGEYPSHHQCDVPKGLSNVVAVAAGGDGHILALKLE